VETQLRRARALLLTAQQLQSSKRLASRLRDWLSGRLLGAADSALAAALTALQP
jgi:hypothetical protein